MSVFSEQPASKWVASNRSAFALGDSFPVTEGHTLVIPRREIASWWEAAPDERADLLALVDVVRAQLDEQYKPDGYNVGFNAGRAAGQTIDHLHIHIIPRRVGDMEDPRGGVRHVIPDRGNFIQPRTAPQAPSLIDARQSKSLRLELIRSLRNPYFDRIDLLVSFIMKSGLKLLSQYLIDSIARGAAIRVLTTDYLHVTDADALAQLLDISEASRTEEGSLDVRVFHDPSTSFHPKAYLFWSSATPTAKGFVGSNNLSWSGIESGIEWSLAVDSVVSLVAGFDSLWSDVRSRPLSHDFLRAYRDLWTPHAGEAVAIGMETEAPTPAATPSDIQHSALAALQRTRAAGHHAALVVMATGLGKTWLAAFDTANFDTVDDGEVPGRVARTLFVAHREEILLQSRNVFRIARPGADLGLFYGEEKQPDAEVLFASVQTIARRLHQFAPDAFDYIVIDEFHHASATSYRKLIDHFRPRFLLGLTATPQRTDGADLLALCGDNLVFDCGLVEGIDRSALVPFHYWGIKDVADFEHIPWRNHRFDPVALAHAVETQQRAQQTFDEWQARCGERTIGFCASITHADFLAEYFTSRNVLAVAVHSGPASEDRRDAINSLRAGVTQVLFSVDVFNEGVDIPEIDSVMMLRPTESPIVFLQQLGRGLRNSPGKEHLTVVDFVGNHDSFLMKPRVLLSLGSAATATNREISAALAKDDFHLPAGCSVHFELEAVDLLRRLAAGKSSGIAEFCRDYANEMGTRPTAAQAARSGYNPRAARPKHQHWFAMLESIGLLAPEEVQVVARYGEDLRAFEMEPATKAYKLVTIKALLAEGVLRTGGSIADVAARSHRLVVADPRLVSDAVNNDMPDPVHADAADWERYWRKWPLAHLAGDRENALFRIDGNQFVPTFHVDPQLGDTFDAMVAELIEWRLADHLLHSSAEIGAAIRCKLSHTAGKPIILIDRKANPSLPLGGVPVLVDGDTYVAKFVKVAVNVVHRTDDDENVLAPLLRGWFGPSAGHPGTNHVVLLAQADGQWTLRPEAAVAHGNVLPFYPSFAVACGSFPIDGRAPALGETIEVATTMPADPTHQFVAVARGESMSGGSDPVHHGDPVLFEWVQGVGRDQLDGQRVLVQLPPSEGSGAVLKELRRAGSEYLLVSADPTVPVIVGTSDMSIVARMVRRLTQSEVSPLAKFIGDRFKRDKVPGLFRLVYNSGNWQSGHVSLGRDVVLFVTLTKNEQMAYGSDYDDHFLSDDRFVWASQNSVGPGSKKGREIVEALDTGTCIHLFVRMKKTDVAFEYCGRAVPIDHHGSEPMSVTFRLLTPLSVESTTRLLPGD